jgi:hypothetical protein
VLVYVLGFCIRRPEEGDFSSLPPAGLSLSLEAATAALRVEVLSTLAQELFDRSHGNAESLGDKVDFSYTLPASAEALAEGEAADGDGDGNGEMEVDGEEGDGYGEEEEGGEEGAEGEEGYVEEEDLEAREEADLVLYESFCLAAFSRLFQRLQHRSRGAVDFVFNIPYIPESILHTLKMLMYSGTLPDVPADSGGSALKRKRKRDKGPADWGTRTAAMELLSHICLVEPVDSSNTTTVLALSQLLWAATSSDFKTRTNAINIVARY